jgi:LCP family protein required for cell wall assembly
VAVPTRRELHKARKRRRRRSERILRGVVYFVVVLLVLVGLGYGYFRFQWGKVDSKPCTACVAAANGAPYNVLLIGSDTRAGETAAQAKQFGTAAEAAGQRSDTIKIVHVDPQNDTASTLSIPRDTYVTLSDMAPGSQLDSQNKINAAFANGPDALIKTIENTFGIPISHYVVIDFNGVEDAVNALGGITMDFPYPVRDQDCSTGVCYNNSGLSVPTAGCQAMTGTEALALSRSRYFQYYSDGEWHSDPSADIGRIERQNLLIAAVVDKARSSAWNPIRINSLLNAVVHDFTIDDGLTATDLFSLAERYHAFNGSQLAAYTLPTAGGYSSVAGDVEVVQPDETSQTLNQFLGGSPGPVVTPPLDPYGNPIIVPATTTTVPPAAAPVTSASTSASVGGSTSTTAPTATSNIPSYDPRPC